MARDYDRYKEGQAAISRDRAARGREIGVIPPIANARRRGRCRASLRLFCETYNPEAFSLAWSPDHLTMIARIEEAVHHGALFAFAMPRGSGKTSIVRMAALWALSYSLRRYTFVIGANDSKAQDTLESLRMFIRFLPDYAADFPEISYPARKLEGIANRASGQTCGGQSTLIEWSAGRIVLPTVPPPEKWPKAWELRADGMVPTSGAVVSASGLTGEGIRGSLLTLSTGEMVRPDLVLIDDPQTPESATSPAQNNKRERLISADVLGMAGPGKSISAVMPCTVISPGDMVDRVLDRSKHPLWRGERTKLLRSMPTDLELWEQYFEVYRRCAQKEPPDFAESNDWYTARRAELEAGAEAGWPERKLPEELSAVQHAMHLYCRDRKAFFSEYQNDPLPPDTTATLVELSPDDVADKVNRCPRGHVPPDCTRLTAGIDVGGSVLYWVVCGWSEQFGGNVVDYGTFPRQNRAYFTAADARPNLQGTFPTHDERARVYAGLKATVDAVVGRGYPRQGGGELRVSTCLVDSGWQSDTVHQFCRQSIYATVLMPSKGYAVTASGRPMSEWQKKPGERSGWNWKITPVTGGGRSRLCVFDPNQWKSHVARSLQTPEAGAGCLQLFGDGKGEHQLFADHCCAEFRTLTEGRGRQVEEWRIRPERADNHYWDALVMATVAASVGGLAWDVGAAAGDLPAAPPAARKTVKLSDLQKKKDAMRENATIPSPFRR